MGYKLIADSTFVQRGDGATIPCDPANIDWQAYQAWLAAGNTPDPAYTLTEAQAAQVAQIQQSCRNAIFAGFTSSALGSAHTYPAKETDQLNLNGSVTASLLPIVASGWTTPFWCEDSAGNWAYVSHTAAQIQQVGADGKAAILANLSKCQNYIQQIMAATTVADVQAVVWQ